MAPQTDSWRRRHGGHGVALAIWLGGRCQASVYEASGPFIVPQRVACNTAGAARARAEELLMEAYPHDCARHHCGPWMRFAPIAGRGRP
jgi:hypothetical protein